MPLRKYDDLIEAVERWSESPDLKAEIPDFVRLAEIEISRDLHWRFTDVEASGTLTAGNDYLTLPADCLEAHWLRLDTTDPGPLDVTIVSAREFTRVKRLLKDGDKPVVARHLGLQLKLAPTPTADWPYTFWYQKLIPALDETNGVNWLITNGFDALLWKACENTAAYREAYDRAAYFKSRFDPAFASLKRLEWRARTGGGNLRVTHDYLRDPAPDRG